VSPGVRRLAMRRLDSVDNGRLSLPPRLARSLRVAWSLLAAVALAACASTAPQLLRDEAGIFTPAARQAGEARLQALAATYAVWPFILTRVEADPPRMLDAPMRTADDLDAPAVAVLFGSDRIVGGGFSRAWTQSAFDRFLFDPPTTEPFAAGDADAALERVLDYFEERLADPARHPRPPAGEPAAPSDGP
jgi:hypothetical protein